MSVLEHYFREEVAWDCGQTCIRHFIIQLSSTAEPQYQPAEKVSWIVATCWRKRAWECAHQEETSGLPRRIKPEDCSVIAVGTEIRFPLIPVKLKDLPAEEGDGTVSISSPFPHPQGLPLSRHIDYGASFPPLPMSRAIQSQVAGNSTCCSTMLKAEIYFEIFMHKGQGLVLK